MIGMIGNAENVVSITNTQDSQKNSNLLHVIPAN